MDDRRKKAAAAALAILAVVLAVIFMPASTRSLGGGYASYGLSYVPWPDRADMEKLIQTEARARTRAAHKPRGARSRARAAA